MKNITYFVGISMLALTLVGCGKKEKPEEQKTVAQEEVAKPVVAERPPVMCDDAVLKNRVVELVSDELLKSSLNALGNVSNMARVEQQLKARLSETLVDVQNITYQNGECQGEIHVVLPVQDVAIANKAFASARVASLEERAIDARVSLIGGNRLVAPFVYQVDGEAVAINTSNPVIAVAAKAMAQSTIAQVSQNRKTARQDNSGAVAYANSNRITPPPTITPRSVPRQEVQEQPVRRTPSPESAVLRPEDVPSREREQELPAPEQAQSPEPRPESKAEPKAEPKTEAKPEPKAEPKAEAKPEPKATPKTPVVQDKGSEITVVESDETY